MPLHSRGPDLYIVPPDSEAIWKAEQREHRAKVVGWLATFLLGALIWVILLCAVLG